MNSALTIAEIVRLLPDTGELRPVVDHLMSHSSPDPSKLWAGSGILGAAGDRVVVVEDALADLQRALDAEEVHRRTLLAHVADALRHRAKGDLEACALAFLEAASLEESRQHFPAAEAFADSAYTATDSTPDSAVRRRALRRRARARRARGDFRAAAEDYRRAFALAEAADDVAGGAEAAIGAGNCHEDQALWDDALVWYRKAIASLEGGDHSGPELWQALLNEHIVLRSQGKLAAAEEALHRAESEAAGDESAAIFFENARGQWALANGDPNAAAHWYRKALTREPGGRAAVTIRLNLSEALLAAGRHLDAAAEARAAEYDAIVEDAHAQLPEAYRLLGRISAERGEGDSFVLFEKALELIAERGLPHVERARTLQAYAEAEAKSGRAERAGELRTEAVALFKTLGIGVRSPMGDRHETVAKPENERDDR